MTDKKPRNHYKSQSRPEDLYLTSWSAFEEYLRFKPQDIIKVECQEREGQRVLDLIKEAKQDLTVDAFQDEFRVLIRSKLCSEIHLESEIKSLPEKATILALDHITDTRNFGAIIRSAAFFGINHIIIPKKRQAAVGLGTVKTCQGALALVNLYEVTNLSRTLKSLKESSFWVVGADMEGESSASIKDRFERVVLVMGSEDKGMSRNIRSTCDVIASIPGAGTLDSLNVSVAAGILLSQFSKSL